MRRRHLLLAGCLALPVTLGAYAQAEADRQLDAAIARLRAGLGPDSAVEWRSRSVDPVTGAARFQGLTIRRHAERLTAEEAVLEGLQADRLGRAVFSGLRFEGPKPAEAPGPMAVTAGRVTFANLLLPAAGQGPAVDWSAFSAGEAQAEGIRVEAPGRGDAELGRLSLTGYAPGTVREAVLEGLRFTDRTEGETRLVLGRARLLGATVPRIGGPADPWALAADSALLEGGELGVEKQRMAMRLGRVQVDGWGEGRLTTLALEGLSLEGEANETGPFTAELGRAAMAGVPLRDTAHALAHDLNPPQAGQGQEQSASVEGLSLVAAGTPLLRVGAARARNGWDPSAQGTATGTVAVEGITVELPAESGGAWLDSLGFKAIRGRLAADSRLIQPEGRLVADPFTMAAEGMGTLNITLDMGGIEVPEAGQPSVSKDDPFALVGQWTLGALSIRYTEEGILRAMLAQQAARERVPEPILRDRYAQMVQRSPVPGLTPGKEPSDIRAMREALARFARELGTLEIAMRPAKPVPMLELMSLAGRPPEQVVRDLGLTIRATPPAR